MGNTTYRLRLAQWTQIVGECNRCLEGMTAKQWLKTISYQKKRLIIGSAGSEKRF